MQNNEQYHNPLNRANRERNRSPPQVQEGGRTFSDRIEVQYSQEPAFDVSLQYIPNMIQLKDLTHMNIRKVNSWIAKIPFSVYFQQPESTIVQELDYNAAIRYLSSLIVTNERNKSNLEMINEAPSEGNSINLSISWHPSEQAESLSNSSISNRSNSQNDDVENQ